MAVAVALAVPTAAPAAAATPVVAVVATEHRETGVTAGAGHVVWSRYDARIARYRLVDRHGEKTTTLPVAPSRIPFDADLGLTAGGRRAVVYPRCTVVEDGTRSAQGGLALSDGARGCSIRMLVLGAPAETAVDTHRPRGMSDVLPRLDHGAITFFRMPRAGAIATRARLLRRTAGGRILSQPGGPLDVVDEDSDQRWDDADGPLGLAADGGVTIFSWDHHRRPATDCTAREPDPLASEIHLRRPGTAGRLLATDCPSAPRISIPGPVAATEQAFTWTWNLASTTLPLPPPTTIARFDRATGAITQAPLPADPAVPGFPVAIDWDGDDLLVAERVEDGTQIVRISGLVFG